MVKKEEKEEGKEENFIQHNVLKEKKISAEESVEDYYPTTGRAETGTKPGLNTEWEKIDT